MHLNWTLPAVFSSLHQLLSPVNQFNIIASPQQSWSRPPLLFYLQFALFFADLGSRLPKIPQDGPGLAELASFDFFVFFL